MTAVVTEVKSMQWYHATEKRAPVTVLNARKGSTSSLLILRDGLSIRHMTTKIVTALMIPDHSAMMLAVAPSSIARTVSVPEVPHATAATTIKAYAMFLDNLNGMTSSTCRNHRSPSCSYLAGMK